MPIAPPRPCRHTGCSSLTQQKYCDVHAGDDQAQRKESDQRRGSAYERGYDRAWQRFRLWFLRRHPQCEASAGCDQLATEVHHVQRLQDGGAKCDESNVQALCKPHHDRHGGQGGRV